MSAFKSVSDLGDIISILAHCPSDNSIMISSPDPSFGLWFPFIKLSHGKSWFGVNTLIKDIFGIQLPINKFFHLTKIWLPDQNIPYIRNVIFQITVTPELKQRSMLPQGKYRSKIQWLTETELLALDITNLKGPTLQYFVSLITKTELKNFNHASEYKLVGNFIDLPSSIILDDKSNNVLAKIAVSAGFDRTFQNQLYLDFIILCSPAIYMNYPIFFQYATSLMWNKDEIPHLFRAADIFQRNALSIRDFINFLLMTEPGVNLTDHQNELRCQFVFRVLAKDDPNHVKKSDFLFFLNLFYKTHGINIDLKDIDKDVTEWFQEAKFSETQIITFNDFLTHFGSLKMRGKLKLFQAPTGIKQYYNFDQTAKTRIRSATKSDSQRDSLQNLDYTLGSHCITLKKTGTALHVEPISTFGSALSSTSLREPLGTELTRQQSMEHFSQKSGPNEIIKWVRYLVKMNQTNKVYSKISELKYNWGNLNSKTVATSFITLCQSVKEIFAKECRVLRINSPCYILGDLHGNVYDLFRFEQILWQLGPGLSPSNLVFLGNYVDFGVFSLEIVMYLFAYKLVVPYKIKMIRGNHEIRQVQQASTFETECKIKFGPELGVTIFHAVNDVFDVLPLAATIDDKLFCCHGGIPPPWLGLTVADLAEIPTTLTNPKEQNELANNLLWNDPYHTDLTNNNLKHLKNEFQTKEGFASNKFRGGIGHIFNTFATDSFLEINEFTHIIRSHETPQMGFNLKLNGKVVTVCSTSKFCDKDNQAACVMANGGKLRFYRLEDN